MPPKREAPAAAPKRFPAWMKTVAEVAQYFEVDLAKGLSKSDVEAKRRVYGFNELDKEEGTPLWKLILEQFDDPLVKVGCDCWSELAWISRAGGRRGTRISV